MCSEFLEIRGGDQLELHGHTSESAQSVTQFIGRDLRAGKEHIAARNPEGEHFPLPHDLFRKSARYPRADGGRVDVSRWDALLEAQGLIQVRLRQKAELYQVFANTDAFGLGGERPLQLQGIEIASAYQYFAQLALVFEQRVSTRVSMFGLDPD